MTRAEQYRNLAKEVRGRVAREKSLVLKAEWENLAKTYSCLAAQAEQNGPAGTTYDPIADTQKRTVDPKKRSRRRRDSQISEI
jgi:hypothetical protein